MGQLRAFAWRHQAITHDGLSWKAFSGLYWRSISQIVLINWICILFSKLIPCRLEANEPVYILYQADWFHVFLLRAAHLIFTLRMLVYCKCKSVSETQSLFVLFSW